MALAEDASATTVTKLKRINECEEVESCRQLGEGEWHELGRRGERETENEIE
jgi:hypothetical protein